MTNIEHFEEQIKKRGFEIISKEIAEKRIEQVLKTPSGTFMTRYGAPYGSKFILVDRTIYKCVIRKGKFTDQLLVKDMKAISTLYSDYYKCIFREDMTQKYIKNIFVFGILEYYIFQTDRRNNRKSTDTNRRDFIIKYITYPIEQENKSLNKENIVAISEKMLRSFNKSKEYWISWKEHTKRKRKEIKDAISQIKNDIMEQHHTPNCKKILEKRFYYLYHTFNREIDFYCEKECNLEHGKFSVNVSHELLEEDIGEKTVIAILMNLIDFEAIYGRKAQIKETYEIMTKYLWPNGATCKMEETF